MTEHPLSTYPKVLLLNLEKTLFPSILRNCHTGVQRGYTSLHSNQQFGNVPFTRESLHHKLSSVFLILAILTSVKWNLRVVLIYISPRDYAFSGMLFFVHSFVLFFSHMVDFIFTITFFLLLFFFPFLITVFFL